MNDGFFSLAELNSFAEKSPRRAAKVDGGGCVDCGLHKMAMSPKMPYTGSGKKRILIVAEAPGEKEDQKGVQLVGQAGQCCRRLLDDEGIDLDVDCWKTNAIRCRPPGNRTPTSYEIGCCRSRLLEDIKKLEPEVIIAMGGIAVESLLGGRTSLDVSSITRWRGWTIPDYTFGAWICPTYHPSYVMRNMGKTFGNAYKDENPAIGLIFKNDVREALRKLGKPMPKQIDLNGSVVTDYNEREVILELRGMRKRRRLVGIDYETTGLRPYRKGHRILSCAVSDSSDFSMAFLMTDRIAPELCDLLADPDVPKCAHNIKFEDQWTSVMLKTDVAGWCWCSMHAAHALDNREEITGLKFLSMVHYGIYDYTADIESYKEASAEESKQYGANAFNRMAEAPVPSLLRYNAIDALVERVLAVDQMRQFRGMINDKENKVSARQAR